MKNFKIFVFIIISFFFASCGEIYVNMDNIEYSVDKSVYKVNEKIEIKFKGQFYPQDEVMSVNIRLKLNKINDTASDEKDLITEMFVHSINKKEIDLKDESFEYEIYKDCLKYVIKNNSIRNIDESIVITIPKEGIYELTLSTRAESYVRYNGGIKSKKINISIEK